MFQNINQTTTSYQSIHPQQHKTLFTVCKLISIAGLIMGVAECILGFLQNSHILGFISGLLLTITSCLLIFMLFNGTKSELVGRRKVIWIVILSIIISILFTTTGVFVVIKILNLTTAPNMIQILKQKADFNTEDVLYQDKFITHLNGIENEVDDFVQENLILKAAEECLTPNIQSRMQKLVKGPTSFLMHSTDTSIVLGFITDTGLYISLENLKIKMSAVCQRRITNKELDLESKCIEPIVECIEKKIS
mmetsp:Transcript_5536/g.4733  ORF Transcript_5536/g.4733 Transcript_5536/m.4733 type:complete len:250 (+) Transcript_5536:11-760(+)